MDAVIGAENADAVGGIAAMHVESVESLEALERLKPAWDAAYDVDPEAQFFLSWNWMSRWLAALGKDWFVLVAKPDAGAPDPVAFLPLRRRTKEQPGGGFRSEINMAGNYASDYTGFLCRPEFEAQAIPAFASHVRTLRWSRLNLEYLRVSEHRVALFLGALSGPEFEVAELDRVNRDNVDNSLCPYAPLPANWQTYLDTRLSANMRQKLRRLLRQLEDSDELRVTHSDGETFERDLETLIRFWTEQWGPRKGAQLSDIQKNYRLMLRNCFADGALLLPVLWQGDKPVGALTILIDARKRTYHFYIAGRDAGYKGPSPGLVLHAHSIRHAIENGFVEYDFLRGNEPYKYSFGVEERPSRSLVVSIRDGGTLGGRLDPRSLPFVLRRSIEHHRAGRVAEAAAGYRQVLDVAPRNAEALYALGQVAASRGDHDEAVRLFETLLAERPDIVKAWARLATSQQALGALPQAAGALCEVIEREPPDAGVYDQLGRVLLALGLFDLAAASFGVAREMNPDHPGIEASLTQALRRRREEPPTEPASQAELAGRVGRLGAIAAVSNAAPGGRR